MPDITDGLKLPQTYRPSLGEEFASLFRAAREGTSFGAAREKMIGARNEEMQQVFQNQLGVAKLEQASLEHAFKVAKYQAERGDKGAEGFLNAAKYWKDYLTPQQQKQIFDYAIERGYDFDDESGAHAVVMRAMDELNITPTQQKKDETTKPAPFQSGSQVLDKDGNFIGTAVFNPNTAEFGMSIPGKKGLQPIPEGARFSTTGNLARGDITGNQFNKLTRDIVDNEVGLKQIARYFENVKDGPSGWRVIADQFTSAIKTFLDANDMDDREFALAVQTGEIQGIAGAIREQVVGPGVMTEQDFLRVLAYVGGDVSALRKPEVVAQQLYHVFKDKYARYLNDVHNYNVQRVRIPYMASAYPEKTPVEYDMEKIFNPRKTEGEAEQTGGEFQEGERITQDGLIFEYVGPGPNDFKYVGKEE